MDSPRTSGLILSSTLDPHEAEIGSIPLNLRRFVVFFFFFLFFFFKKQKRGIANRETPPPRLPNPEGLHPECVPDGLARRDGSADPHEGPQRKPWGTVGHVQVSWIYVCVFPRVD